MNRSADWLHQAQADLVLAGVSAAAGQHEWACFACHQAVEKALKGLHLRHGRRPATGQPLGVAQVALWVCLEGSDERRGAVVKTSASQSLALAPWARLNVSDSCCF
jgi:hypothetical protein